MTTTTAIAPTPTPAEIAELVPPGVASKFGRGRGRLLDAWRQGLVSLPDTVTSALTALHRTELARRDLLAVDPGASRNAYNEAVAAALQAGHDLPPPDEVAEVERRQRLVGIQQVALDQARGRFADRLEGALADGDQLVAEHVRPALLKLYGEARGLLPARRRAGRPG